MVCSLRLHVGKAKKNREGEKTLGDETDVQMTHKTPTTRCLDFSSWSGVDFSAFQVWGDIENSHLLVNVPLDSPPRTAVRRAFRYDRMIRDESSTAAVTSQGFRGRW